MAVGLVVREDRFVRGRLGGGSLAFIVGERWVERVEASVGVGIRE